jgi:hypothetical protein
VNGSKQRSVWAKNYGCLVGRFSSGLVPACRGAAAGQSRADRLSRHKWRSFHSVTSPEAFRQGLRELGYVEGKNILAEYRYGEGKVDRLPSLVAEFVHLKVDVLVVTALPAIRAAKQATKTIPHCHDDSSGSGRDWANR